MSILLKNIQSPLGPCVVLNERGRRFPQGERSLLIDSGRSPIAILCCSAMNGLNGVRSGLAHQPPSHLLIARSRLFTRLDRKPFPTTLSARTSDTAE